MTLTPFTQIHGSPVDRARLDEVRRELQRRRVQPRVRIGYFVYTSCIRAHRTVVICYVLQSCTSLIPFSYIPTYASYLAKYLVAYRERGIEISWLTLQNEPKHSANGYPTMTLSAQNEKDLLNALSQEVKNTYWTSRFL